MGRRRRLHARTACTAETTFVLVRARADEPRRRDAGNVTRRPIGVTRNAARSRLDLHRLSPEGHRCEVAVTWAAPLSWSTGRVAHDGGDHCCCIGGRPKVGRLARRLTRRWPRAFPARRHPRCASQEDSESTTAAPSPRSSHRSDGPRPKARVQACSQATERRRSRSSSRRAHASPAGDRPSQNLRTRRVQRAYFALARVPSGPNHLRQIAYSRPESVGLLESPLRRPYGSRFW
jgi:hypothetical protein